MRWLSRLALAVLLSTAAGCGAGARAPATGAAGGTGSAGNGGNAGSSGVAGSAAAGTSGGAGAGGGAGTAAAAGATGAAGTGAAGTGGGAGAAGAGAGSAGSGGAGTTGNAGSSGGAGAGGAGGGAGAGGQAGGGVFVMCDDHADFNGRGRCAATGKVGAVFALQNATAAGATTTLTATFGSTSPPADAGCTQQSAGGACTAFTCPRTPAVRAAGPAAGTITAKSNGGVMVTIPAADGTYDVSTFPRALWTLPKAALAFSAAGGATPAFGETFCGPPGATISKPAAVPGAGLTIDRASDLALQWTGGAVGDLEVVLRDDTTAPASVLEVRCFFVGASGQGTIPKAALQLMGAGAHTAASYIWVREIGIATGGTCVELTGIATNLAATGVPWNGNATFQ